MSKEHKTSRESRKKAAMTPKEKKLAKRIKKENSSPGGYIKMPS